MKKFSERSTVSKTPRYLIVTGWAYDKVLSGSNPTTQVKASLKNRQTVYRDLAVRLTDEDLDALNGTEGAPLCYEHNEKDVVGHVHHAWINEDQGRCLKIVGRVPLHDEQGRPIKRNMEILRDVENGDISGFSVGYKAVLGEGNQVEEKVFNEISLVKKPFFNDCKMVMHVTASEGKFVVGSK
jgi:hypothetical protein